MFGAETSKNIGSTCGVEDPTSGLGESSFLLLLLIIFRLRNCLLACLLAFSAAWRGFFGHHWGLSFIMGSFLLLSTAVLVVRYLLGGRAVFACSIFYFVYLAQNLVIGRGGKWRLGYGGIIYILSVVDCALVCRL